MTEVRKISIDSYQDELDWEMFIEQVEDEIVSWVEHHGEPHLRGEQWYGSPCCKDGFEEYVEDDEEEEDV